MRSGLRRLGSVLFVPGPPYIRMGRKGSAMDYAKPTVVDYGSIAEHTFTAGQGKRIVTGNTDGLTETVNLLGT